MDFREKEKEKDSHSVSLARVIRLRSLFAVAAVVENRRCP
jgi:hypothetical protein